VSFGPCDYCGKPATIRYLESGTQRVYARVCKKDDKRFRAEAKASVEWLKAALLARKGKEARP
jgi:hypothetical protein